MDSMDTSKGLATVKKNALVFQKIGSDLFARANELEIVKVEDTQVASAILKECQKTEQELEERRTEITKPVNDFIREVNTAFKEVAVPIIESKNIIKGKILAYNQEQERIKLEEDRKRFAEEQARLRKLEEERRERERIEQEKREAEEKKLAEERERLRKIEEAQLAKELEARKASDEEKKKAEEAAESARVEREKIENERLEIERQKRELLEEQKKLEEEKRLNEEKMRVEQEAVAREKELKIKGIRKSWSWKIVDEANVPRAFCTPDPKKIYEAIKSGVRDISGITIFESTNVR